MSRKKSRNFRNIKSAYSIIVDGKTEIWYFQLMKNHEEMPRVDIKPDLPKKKNLNELFELAIEKAKNYDKVFLLLDFDAIIHNRRINEFKKHYKRVKRNKKIDVLANNPCLEFWFLLHFEKTAKYFKNCKNAEEMLKKSDRLKNYTKTEKYFKEAQTDIYTRLKPLQTTALKNAGELGDFSFNSVEEAKAEIYKIINFLLK